MIIVVYLNLQKNMTKTSHETNNKAHTHAPRMYTPMYYEPQNEIEFNETKKSTRNPL